METERVSAESHDQNFIEKVGFHTRERRVEVTPKTKECVCVSLEGAFVAVAYSPFLSALRKICDEKRKKELCQKKVSHHQS